MKQDVKQDAPRLLQVTLSIYFFPALSKLTSFGANGEDLDVFKASLTAKVSGAS